MHDELLPRPAAAYGITANLGVTLVPSHDDLLMVVPNMPPDPAQDGSEFVPPPAPFPMPLIPAKLIEEAARLLRQVQRQDRCASWLLYVDLLQHDWTTWLPPQTCGPDDCR